MKIFRPLELAVFPTKRFDIATSCLAFASLQNQKNSPEKALAISGLLSENS
jgi:hypothetical protein